MQDQHFLVDERILEKIVSVSEIKPEETVLEIGAGTGLLTEKISRKARKVIAVELDKRFRKNLEGIGENVDIIFGNALREIKNLRFDKIVSNIPYSISEPLIQELLYHNFMFAVLIVPKSFYYKLKGNSKLGIFCSLFFHIDFIDIVPKTSFEPKPKTNSLIIKLVPKPLKTDTEKFLKHIFLQRDKKLKNAIMRALFLTKKLTKNQAREHLKALKTNNITDSLLNKKLSNLNARDLDFLVKKLKI